MTVGALMATLGELNQNLPVVLRVYDDDAPAGTPKTYDDVDVVEVVRDAVQAYDPRVYPAAVVLL